MHWRGGWTALIVTSIARAVLVLVVSLAVVTLVPAFAGWTPTVVMSGSMSPSIRPGDVVVARPVAASRLRIGQVVLVDDPDHAGALRLHRLVGATRSGDLLLRGDGNGQDDSSPVRPAAVHGVAALRVPMIGLPFLWAATKDAPALVLTAALAAVLLAACVLFRRDDELVRPLSGGGARARSGTAPGTG